MPASDPVEFILGEAVATAPMEVWHAAKRSLLDLIGVAAAGRKTEASRIAHDVAFEHWPRGTKSATLIFDGRVLSPAGAAFGGAQTIDSIDAHDGYKPGKGHAGVAILPGLLAMMEAESAPTDDAEFLKSFVIGYEVACRVSAAQHKTCPDYHASGSWNAVGVAAAGARTLNLSAEQTRQALGIAEYFGPRAQIMRVVDEPTMVKDASNWGAMTGVISTYLAQAGLTGAPALTVERADASEFWNNCGSRWLITEQYFKLWPTCRWAQPAVKAALELKSQYDIQHHQIRSVTIVTFHEACRLAGHAPSDTDQAQYAIGFPTACAFVRGRVGVDEIAGSGLCDRDIQSLSTRIQFAESPEYNAAFPARRLAHLQVDMQDGRLLESAVTEPPGDPEHPLSDEQLIEKFHMLAAPVLSEVIAARICRALVPLDMKGLDLAAILAALKQSVA